MADKKKVFWLIQQNTYVGGIETVTTQLANMLCDDFDITVISAARLANHSIYKLSEKIKLESLDIPITFMQFDKFLKTYLSKRQFGKFLKLLFSSLHRFCLGRLA